MSSFRRSTADVVEEVENSAGDSTLARTKSDFMDEELKRGGLIGDGSFAHVFEAFYMGKKVAVKVFRINSPEAPFPLRGNWDEVIRNEADIMRMKLNKHILGLLHHSKSKKVLIIEHCANGSIFDFIRQESNRPIVEDWSSRLKWMYGVALGMLVLHEEPPSVVHRDLKSSNILLDEKLEAKIADFGLAVKTSEISLTHKNCSYPNLAMTYQPPEVTSEGRYSTKSDVYSFGLMMHELLLLKGPYGLSLDAGYVDAKVTNLQKNGEKPKIPEDRTTIPGKWNPCLEDYIKLIEECLDDIPERRPAFREIAQRLALIKRQYEKARMMPHKYQPIIRVLGILVSILVFLTCLFLLFECSRITLLSKKDGNQVYAKMKSDEYYFFEVLVCIGMMTFGSICGWIVWIERKSIWNFVMTCAQGTRRGWEYLISRLNKIFSETEDAISLCPKQTAFAVPPRSEGMTERSTDIEMGLAPSLCPESTDQSESASHNSLLQSALSPSSSQERLMVDDEQMVMIDDDLS